MNSFMVTDETKRELRGAQRGKLRATLKVQRSRAHLQFYHALLVS